MADRPAPRISLWLLALLVLVGGVGLLVLNVISGGPPREALVEGAGDDDVAQRLESLLRGGIRSFEERVEGRLAELSPRIRTGPGPLRVVASDVHWEERGGPLFLDAPSVRTLIDSRALARGDVILSNASIQDPLLNLVQAVTDGPWNYERVLAPLLDGDRRDNGRETVFRVRGLAIDGARADVEMPDRRMFFTELMARIASVELSGPRLAVPVMRVDTVDTRLRVVDDTTRIFQLAATDALLTFRQEDIFFEVERFSVNGARFADARGIWDPDLGGYGVDATMRGEEVRLADLGLGGADVEIPEDAIASFDLEISPLPGDRTLLRLGDLDLVSGESRTYGSLTAVVGGELPPALRNVDLQLDPVQVELLEVFAGPLPYLGTLRGRVTGTAEALRFDLDTRLRPESGGAAFSAQLTGEASLPDGGFRLGSLTAELQNVPLSVARPYLPGLPFNGRVTGTVSATGAPGRSPLDVDVNVQVARGAFTLSGTVDLTGAVPVYDVAGQLNGIELRGLFEPDMPPARIYASYAIQGRGTDPETARLTATAHGSFTGWRTEPGDTVAIDVALRDGVFSIADFRSELGPVRLQAEGEWRLTDPGSGALAYALEVESLEPLGAYLPFLPPAFSQGQLATSGQISGTVDDYRISGVLTGRDLRYGEWSMAALDGEYQYDAEPSLPRIGLSMQAASIETPSGPFETATLELTVAQPTFDFAFDAVRPTGGVFDVEADGRIETAGGRVLALRRFEIDLQEERWRLAERARIVWSTDGDLLVEDLRIARTDGEGVFEVTGRVLPFDESNFGFVVRGLPVADVLALAGREELGGGVLSAEGTVRGPEDSPEFAVDFTLTEGTVRGVPLQSLRGDVRFEGGRLIGDATALFGEARAVEIVADLPLAVSLGLPPRLSLRDGESMDLRLTADDVPLETLSPAAPQLRELAGVLEAEVSVGGTPDQPALRGSLNVRDGAALFVPLNQRYTDIVADLELEGRRLDIRQLRAVSDGALEVTGGLTFEEITNPTADLVVQFRGFRPQGVDDLEDAAVSGRLLVRGLVREPRVGGSLRINDGTIFVSALQQGADFSNQLVGAAIETSAFGQGLDARPDEGMFAGLRIDTLRLEAGNDLWFRTRDARAQLAGELRIMKPGAAMQIFGELEGERGTFTLRVGPVVRRFEILHARVRFFGEPEPNPGLDVTASRTVIGSTGTPVEIQAHVQGTLNSPRLSLTTPDGVQVPESELLSFLVFGQPSFALGQRSFGGEDLLRDAALFGGFSDLISIQIEEALISEVGLPLDYFQIRPGSFSGGNVPTVVMGKELADELFLTVNTPLATFEALTASLEWRVDREWTLEAGREPVDRSRILRNAGPVGGQFTEIEQQLFIAIRRRWTY